MVGPPIHSRDGLENKSLLDAVCFFGVVLRCTAFLPSGIHDNAVIRSTSHLLPLTLLKETIMGCDGPLSMDEAKSHFLDDPVCVYARRRGCFITHKSHIRSSRLADSQRGGLAYQWNKFCLSLSLVTPTLWTDVCMFLLFNNNRLTHITVHIIVSVLQAAQRHLRTAAPSATDPGCSDEWADEV